MLDAMIQKLSTIVAWLALAFIIYATLSSIDARPVLAELRVEHFAAFAMTGLAFALAYPRRLFLVVTIVVGSALVLETLQLLTPDRHGRIVDAIVKAAGGLCGIGVGQVVRLLLPARISRAIDLTRP